MSTPLPASVPDGAGRSTAAASINGIGTAA
jgi:hypothetical protein